MSKLKITAEPGQSTVTFEREFDATVEQLFKAHTEPDILSQWWGVFDGIKTEVEIFEAKFGGKWRFISTKEGEDQKIIFRGINHIVEPNRLVYTFEFENEPGSVCLETVNFTAKGNKTILHGVTSFLSNQDRDAMINTGMEYGTEGSYKSLDSVVAKM